MVHKKSRIKRRRGVGNLEALDEAYNRLLWYKENVVEDWEKNLVGDILRKWDKVSEAIDTALLNHGYWVMTIPITRGDHSLFLKFEKNKLRKRWVLADVSIGERVGWGFRWEYLLDEDKLIRRDRETREVVAL